MSYRTSRGFKRFNLDDPADLKFFTESGGIWRFKQYWQIAIDAIARGDIRVENAGTCPRKSALAFRPRSSALAPRVVVSHSESNDRIGKAECAEGPVRRR
jgi:hypothetical protein